MTLKPFPLVLAALLASAAQAAAAAPDGTALKALASAQIRLAQREQLDQLTRDAASEARQLQASADAARRTWEAGRRAGDTASEAVTAATDCISLLPGALTAVAEALDRMTAAQSNAARAVGVLATADGPALAPAARTSNAAARHRTATEQTALEHTGTLRKLLQRCSAANRTAQARLDQAFSQHANLANQVNEVAAREQTLRTQWARAAAGHRAAVRAGWVPAAPPRLALPGGGLAAEFARTRTPTPSSSPGLREVDRAWHALQQPEADPLPAALAVARLLDAASYLDLASGPTGCADAASCAALRAERAELMPRIAQAQEQLRQARRVTDTDRLNLAELTGPLHAALRTHRHALAAADAKLPALLEAATANSQLASSALMPLERQASIALKQAETDWEAAWRMAHATEPKRPGRTGMFTAAVEAPAMSSAMASMGSDPDLRSHAYEMFEAWNNESRGFGAYTYVLMRSASDFAQTDTRRRFAALLTTLQTLPDARLVEPTQAYRVNLFCIPGSRVTPGVAASVTYASDLGQQLKLRAQNGLLTRKEVSQKLLASPGPFLITVPGRMADLPVDAPLLFADLSDYPDEAIADLATHYMNGLVNDFPADQQLWRPPVLQRVALVMIHLATGTGELISTLMPTAEASPPR